MTHANGDVLGTVCFALAILHTFIAPYLRWRLKTEVIFGLWAVVFLLAWGVIGGSPLAYLSRQRFVEPLFVFFLMMVTGSGPVISAASRSLKTIEPVIPLPGPMARMFGLLTVGPLLGSLISEPAAMTLVAVLLRGWFFDRNVSLRLKYAVLAVLFVNVSVGGVLTSFAAPPVLMVAKRFDWDSSFMFFEFGWRGIGAVVTNSLILVSVFRSEVMKLPMGTLRDIPTHSFLGRVEEAAPVAVFLGGLVVLGGVQSWWVAPLITSLSPDGLFWSAMMLTAVADNAALTYLGAQVSDLSDIAKSALVAGAVVGGGLTVIANAPNPAGFAILQSGFKKVGFHALKLLAFAIPPTLVAAFWFWWI